MRIIFCVGRRDSGSPNLLHEVLYAKVFELEGVPEIGEVVEEKWIFDDNSSRFFTLGEVIDRVYQIVSGTAQSIISLSVEEVPDEVDDIDWAENGWYTHAEAMESGWLS